MWICRRQHEAVESAEVGMNMAAFDYEQNSSSARSQPCIFGAKLVQHLTASQDSKLKAQAVCLLGRSQHVVDIPARLPQMGKPAR